MLVRRSNKSTNYTLPVVIQSSKGVYKTIFYYECEGDLFKAYRQLKAIHGKVKPLYPVIIV